MARADTGHNARSTSATTAVPPNATLKPDTSTDVCLTRGKQFHKIDRLGRTLGEHGRNVPR
eukprot:8802783-Lingulodinium_polyedra.AAC.1